MKWIRPSGSIIELEDTPNLSELALSNGWTREQVQQEVVTETATKVKRTRRTRAQMEASREG